MPEQLRKGHFLGAKAPVIDSIFRECLHRRGDARIPRAAIQVLSAVANVLNIAWIEDALRAAPGARHLPTQRRVPRPERCEGARPSRARDRRRARGDSRARGLMA